VPVSKGADREGGAGKARRNRYFPVKGLIPTGKKKVSGSELKKPALVLS